MRGTGKLGIVARRRAATVVRQALERSQLRVDVDGDGRLDRVATATDLAAHRSSSTRCDGGLRARAAVHADAHGPRARRRPGTHGRERRGRGWRSDLSARRRLHGVGAARRLAVVGQGPGHARPSRPAPTPCAATAFGSWRGPPSGRRSPRRGSTGASRSWRGRTSGRVLARYVGGSDPFRSWRLDERHLEHDGAASQLVAPVQPSDDEAAGQHVADHAAGSPLVGVLEQDDAGQPVAVVPDEHQGAHPPMVTAPGSSCRDVDKFATDGDPW